MRNKVQVWISVASPEGGDLYLILKTRPERGAFWQPVTGGVEPEESVEAAALREAQEETGLSFLDPPQPISEPFEFVSRGETCVEYGFSLKVAPGEVFPPQVALDPHEHTEYQWVTEGEAIQKIRFASNADLLKTLARSH